MRNNLQIREENIYCVQIFYLSIFYVRRHVNLETRKVVNLYTENVFFSNLKFTRKLHSFDLEYMYYPVYHCVHLYEQAVI